MLLINIQHGLNFYHFIAGNQNEPNIVDLNINVNFGLINSQKAYPLTWKIQLNFKDNLRIINGVNFNFNLNFSLNETLDQASLSTTFKSSESDIKFKFNLVDKDHIKKVTFDLQCDEKPSGKILFFETNFLRSNPGELTFEMKNNLIPVAKFHELLNVEFTRTNFEAVFKYIRPFETKPLEEVMKMRVENNNNEITLKANVSGKPLCGNPCDWNMEFDGKFSGENVKISIIEPFTNAGKINLEGSWTKNPLKINVKGNLNAIEYQFIMVANKEKIQLDIKKGSDNWTLNAKFPRHFKGLDKEISLEIKGSHIDKIEMIASYSVYPKKISGHLKVKIPPYVELTEAKVDVEFDFPNKLSFKIKTMLDGESIMDLDTMYDVAQDFSDIRYDFT